MIFAITTIGILGIFVAILYSQNVDLRIRMENQSTAMKRMCEYCEYRKMIC